MIVAVCFFSAGTTKACLPAIPKVLKMERKGFNAAQEEEI